MGRKKKKGRKEERKINRRMKKKKRMWGVKRTAECMYSDSYTGGCRTTLCVTATYQHGPVFKLFPDGFLDQRVRNNVDSSGSFIKDQNW